MKNSPFQDLQQAYLFQDLPDTALQELFQLQRQETYQNGQAILREGTRTDGIYLIVDGEIELSRKTKEANKTLFTLQSGDVLGEAELFFSERRMVSARARAETTVLFWEKETFFDFMASYPEAIQRLKHSAYSRRIAFQRAFTWLAEGEVIHTLTRRHPVHLLQGLSLPAALVIASIPLAVHSAHNQLPPLLWVAIFMAITGSGWTVWRILDYFNDFYILTNQRAVWLEKVIGVYERRQETPLQWVLSTGVSATVLGRMLGFGDIHIRTYTGQMSLTQVPDPPFFVDQLEELWSGFKQLQGQVDRDAMLHTIAQRLAGDSEEDRDANLSPADAEAKTEAKIGLDQWSFRTRFENEGVISYRKHWAVLFRGLLLPLALSLLTIFMIVLRLTGSLAVFNDERFLLYTLPMALIFLFWTSYRYMDWANEIFQITPTQIIDIHKKPLGQETRKVASLENILGTEVNQKGLLGLILNFGDVTTRVGTSEFVFEGVLNPNAVQQDIVRAQNAFLQRRSKNEQHQRQMEVVEWLSAYHEETQAEHSGSDEPKSEFDNDLTSQNHSGPGPAPESS
ncbi:MAG: cyclic nucleotide-binding domain-containing protein [Anaerolineales bacterium]|nr:cyclic nucleotide-binding domain-containing protein [Anaerolineales bacterium]